MRRHVLVISRDQAHRYGYLSECFQGHPPIQVILDRRFAERRQHVEPPPEERRRRDSRSRPDADELIRTLGWALVCLD